LARSRDAAIEHAGDIRMFHQGQGLPFGLKTSEDRAGIHSGFDELERDVPFNRLGLLGDPDLAHPPFAEFLLEQIPAGYDNVGPEYGLEGGGELRGRLGNYLFDPVRVESCESARVVV